MIKLFKSKRGEVRIEYPAYAFRNSIDSIVHEVKELAKKFKELQIVESAGRWVINYRKSLVFDLYRKPVYEKGIGLVNVVQHSDECPMDLENVVLKPG